MTRGSIKLFQTETGSFRVLDFAPRFSQVEGVFHPKQLHRIIEPVDGNPVVRVRFEPRVGWSTAPAGLVHGARHLRVEGFSSPVWLETDVPLGDVVEQKPFALTERKHFVLTWGTPVEEALPALCDRYLNATIRYWQMWVKHTNIPPLWQQEPRQPAPKEQEVEAARSPGEYHALDREDRLCSLECLPVASRPEACHAGTAESAAFVPLAYRPAQHLPRDPGRLRGSTCGRSGPPPRALLQR